jgi:hypothetical protein
MEQKITEPTPTSRRIWEGLEELVREHVQRLRQSLL